MARLRACPLLRAPAAPAADETCVAAQLSAADSTYAGQGGVLLWSRLSRVPDVAVFTGDRRTPRPPGPCKGVTYFVRIQ